MLIIADSSALIALAACDALDLLLEVFDDVKIPEVVYAETVIPEKPHSNTLASFLTGRVVTVDTSRSVLAVGGLGRGEIEAMTLYKQLSADLLLIDDQRARMIAEHNHIRCIGALGFLLIAKQRGKLDRIAPYVQKLRRSSLYYGDALLG